MEESNKTKDAESCKLVLYQLNGGNKENYIRKGNAVKQKFNAINEMLEDERRQGKNEYFDYVQKQKYFNGSNNFSIDMAKECEARWEIMMTESHEKVPGKVVRTQVYGIGFITKTSVLEINHWGFLWGPPQA